MGIPTNVTRLPTNLITITLLVSISTVVGCGVMPAGQGSEQDIILMRAIGPSPSRALPLCLSPWFTRATNAARFSGIATTEEGAKGFVQRLVMQTIIDVLERQGCSALLPDAVISTILSQLTVDISYTPMNCPMVTSPEEMHRAERAMTKTYCIIVGNTVTGICTVAMGRGEGTESTTNIIMANWSRTMWQSVVDRAVRMLASDLFGSHFILARATVSGN
ncbi:hypothetical protein KIN20_030882 [Parelaphostrongylus tenuis]|uniref:Uncharacterized protein n=1 Tax=Parelaphostrongylus tenuis TaxID=148309 RepID=A0AAD5WH74_PARTN|nr:hypothetical protein KIN20_030882 [Parelaphostrongylus tenuis]